MLKLTRAQEQDRGLYSCLASNEAGEARRDFSVEVLGTSPPGSLGCPPILPSSLIFPLGTISESQQRLLEIDSDSEVYMETQRAWNGQDRLEEEEQRWGTQTPGFGDLL